MDRCRGGIRVLCGAVLMGAAIVDQVSMLRASGMLDQEHVPAVRALEKQSQQGRENASTPNH
jgi:hypothetical protein